MLDLLFNLKFLKQDIKENELNKAEDQIKEDIFL